MRYISIGDACNIKHQIDKHKGGSETLFFDWLLTDIESVIKILSCDNITHILNFDNIIKNSSKITIKSLSYCESVHEDPNDLSDTAILNFIDKYTRRFNRIIEYIKSDEKIYFLRYTNVKDDDKKRFIETILKINPQCNFALVVIDVNDYINGISKIDHCLDIKIANDIKRYTEWTTSFLDWKQIFIDIENNI
jgi:hypothetical protein